jgi:hypothetical protein
MPALFDQHKMLDLSDVAEALAFLVTPEAKGIDFSRNQKYNQGNKR